jgi:hypothetical protein
MNNIKINGQILDGIKEQCGNDRITEKFLTELIYEEAEHPGQWRWKDTYNKIMEKYLAILEVEK